MEKHIKGNEFFDALTGIERDFVERGYKRFKYDYLKKVMIEMKLKGDSSYYFSSMDSLCFNYRKNDIGFAVGLTEKHMSPTLSGCNKQVNFNGQYRYLDSCRSFLIERMLSEIGNVKFIESVESDTVIDFDMRVAEKLYNNK